MKKLFLLSITIIFTLCITGCDVINNFKNKIINKNEESIGLENPMQSYDSLDEINEKVGVKIINPDISGMENKKYYVIDDNIAEFDFELNGNNISIRGSSIIDEDISGIFDDQNYFESENDFVVFTTNYYLVRFFISNKQYTVVCNEPKDLDEESFMNICTNLQYSMKTNLNDPLVGVYLIPDRDDIYCIIEGYNDQYIITVDILVSDNEYNSYEMSAMKEDNKISYSKEIVTNIVFDENDNENTKETTNTFDGYFVFENNKLRWEKASEESLQELVFVKGEY